MTIFLCGLVVFITHALEAVTGFGCTVLALPFITMIIGLQKAVILLTVLAWILAIYIVLTKWKKINFCEFIKIAFFVGLGLPLGMLFFRIFDYSILKKILACFIIFSSGKQLISFLIKKNEKQEKQNKFVMYAVLFLGGIVHGMFSSGGPLIVLYASKKLKDKGEFRATLCLLWAVLNTIIIIGYFFLPNVLFGTFEILKPMIVFLVFGIIAGELIHGKIKSKVFSVIVFSMLFVTGFFMFFF